MSIICELKGISKFYNKKAVLSNVNLQLEKGKIYGFIGRNGAGKTTTMRIITGLARPDKGTLIIDGISDEKNIIEKRKKIGCIIETPALYLDMTAKQNLKSMCILHGVSLNVISELLDLVGLSNEGRKRVRHFSLGMKQRLGIGMALVNNPEFLILDEPINGLDPDGIVEVRYLIKNICETRKTTILISSHILSELYQMVDNYILINKGEIIEMLTHEELNKKTQKYVLIKSDKTKKIREIIEKQLKIKDFEIVNDDTVKIYNSENKVLEIMNIFASMGIEPSAISVSEDSLEEYFFKRIGK